MARLMWFWRFLFGNPLVQALVLGFLGILSNVLSGAYVFDITRTDAEGKQYLDWWSTPHSSTTFWCLCGVLALVGLYGWGIARIGAKARRVLGQEEAICARAIEELLPYFLDKMKTDISQGQLKSLQEALRMLGMERDQGP